MAATGLAESVDHPQRNQGHGDPNQAVPGDVERPARADLVRCRSRTPRDRFLRVTPERILNQRANLRRHRGHDRLEQCSDEGKVRLLGPDEKLRARMPARALGRSDGGMLEADSRLPAQREFPGALGIAELELERLPRPDAAR